MTTLLADLLCAYLASALDGASDHPLVAWQPSRRVTPEEAERLEAGCIDAGSD